MVKNFLIKLKKSATDAIKTISRRVIKKKAEATDHLNSNKIANKFTENLPQNNSETDLQREENSL